MGQVGIYLKVFLGKDFILAHLHRSKVTGWASADSLGVETACPAVLRSELSLYRVWIWLHQGLPVRTVTL